MNLGFLMLFQFRVVIGEAGLSNLLGWRFDAPWHGFCRTTTFSVGLLGFVLALGR